MFALRAPTRTPGLYKIKMTTSHRTFKVWSNHGNTYVEPVPGDVINMANITHVEYTGHSLSFRTSRDSYLNFNYDNSKRAHDNYVILLNELGYPNQQEKYMTHDYTDQHVRYTDKCIKAAKEAAMAMDNTR